MQPSVFSVKVHQKQTKIRVDQKHDIFFGVCYIHMFQGGFQVQTRFVSFSGWVTKKRRKNRIIWQQKPSDRKCTSSRGPPIAGSLASGHQQVVILLSMVMLCSQAWVWCMEVSLTMYVRFFRKSMSTHLVVRPYFPWEGGKLTLDFLKQVWFPMILGKWYRYLANQNLQRFGGGNTTSFRIYRMFLHNLLGWSCASVREFAQGGWETSNSTQIFVQRQSMSIPNFFCGYDCLGVIFGLCGGSFFTLVFVVGTFSRKNFKFKKLWGNTYFVNIYSEYRFLLPFRIRFFPPKMASFWGPKNASAI